MFFLLKKSSDFWPPFEPKRGPKWEQRATKNGQKGYLKRDFQKDTEKEVKLSPNGAKINQKSIENWAKFELI